MAERVNRDSPHALIMKGGGIKGLAYVGALRELEKHVQFNWFVGTSAGAIIAVLLGAGYSVDQLETILKETNFKLFLDANPFFAVVNLFIFHGLYRATKLTAWLDRLLAEKLKSPFRVCLEDLPYRVTVYACRRDDDPLRYDKKDPTTRGMAAAFVARCSMSIPFFFTPEKEEGLNVLDGGMRYNYPVRATLAGEPVPFVGLYLGRRVYEHQVKNSLIRDILNIWAEASDISALREYQEQTIIIDPRPISTLDFDLSDLEKDFLLLVGRSAALEFLEPTHPELSAELNWVRAEAEGARQQVIALRRTKKTRALRKFAFVLAFALALGGMWHLVPGIIPKIRTPLRVTEVDLDKSLQSLIARNEAGPPDPRSGTIIYQIDWDPSWIHPADQFTLKVDAHLYTIQGFITGRANNGEEYSKNTKDCVVESHHLSCVVPTAYKTAYLFLRLGSPNAHFDTELKFLKFTAEKAG